MAARNAEVIHYEGDASFGHEQYGCQDRTNYGTAATPTEAAVPMLTADIQVETNWVRNEGVGAGVDTDTMYIAGRNASFSYSGEARYLACLGHVLANAYGGLVTTGESSPYTHTFSGADFTASATNSAHLQPWTIAVSPGNFGESGNDAMEALGCVGSNLELSGGAPGEAIQFKVDGIAKTVLAYTGGAVSSVLPSTRPMMFGEATWEIGFDEAAATTIYPESWTFTSNLNLQNNRSTEQDARFFDCGTVYPGKREQRLNIKVPIESDDYWDWLIGHSGTESNYVAITGTFTDDTSTFTLAIAKAQIINWPMEETNGDVAPYYHELEIEPFDGCATLTIANAEAGSTYVYA